MKNAILSQRSENRGASLTVRRPNWTLVVAVLGLVLAAASAWAQNATINWYRVANGGGVSSGNGCTLMGTIGQAEPGFVQAGKVALAEGFWSADAVVPPKAIYWNVASGNWSNPANWVPSEVPGPRDEVHIINGGTATLDANTTAGTLFLSNGSTLAGPGKLTLNGALTWTQGTISGAVQCNGGTVGGVSFQTTFLTGGELINSGHLTVNTVSQNSIFYTGSGSVISNLAGATLDWATDAGTTWYGGTHGTIYNAGLFRKTVGTGTTSIQETFNNLANGTVEADSGILSLTYTGNYSGVCAASGTAILDFPSGTHNFLANSSFSGNGVIRCSGATININGPATVAASAMFTLVAGTLAGPGELTCAGPFIWTGGTISGAVQCNGGTVGGVNFQTTFLTGGQLINSGHLTVNTVSQNSIFYTGSGSVISNLAGATLDWATDAGTTWYGGTHGTIYNAGLFRKSAGTGTTSIQDNFTNTATLETWTGTLQFSQPCVQNAGQTRLLGGNLRADSGFLLNGGRLEGTNTLIGNVVNRATVAPAGAASAGLLTINGNYTETGAAVLEIELGGATPGAGFDKLSVSGTATLAGTLSVSQINGFVPPNNSTYNFITAGSSSGAFSATNYPSSLPGVAVSYAANGASLTVGNTPSAPPVLTIRLIGGSSASLAWPSAAAGYHLEANSNLASAVWAPVSQTPADDGTTKTLIVSVSSSAPMFYRLHLSP